MVKGLSAELVAAAKVRRQPTFGDKGVFWKSPLRPRTMLSLEKAGILSSRPDQVNERAPSFAAPCELMASDGGRDIVVPSAAVAVRMDLRQVR